jgi:GNAT superfamily N-acetyltransferase
MIAACSAADVPAIHEIVNEAAAAYRGIIPADCWHEPYMPREELQSEIAAGVEFSGFWDDGTLVGVMAIQPVADVTLIRHAYVRPEHQRRGIGGALLRELMGRASDRALLVGTWADARWAIEFYERHGFRLVGPDETRRLLQTYWSIPERQAEVSVVLAAEDR